MPSGHDAFHRDQVQGADGDAVVAPANPVVVVTTSGDGLWYALLGLAGVLVGAVISGGFNLWVARRTERADGAAESKRHDVEIRRAARLIDDDIRVASDAVTYSLEHKQWWPSAQRLTSVGWQEYRGILAPDLSDLAWRQVGLAVTVIDRLQWVRDVSAKAHSMEMANNVWNHADHGETPAASVTTQAHGDEGDANNHAC